jgi:metal-dependent amidase/aminoacylase/carboxypeptidase family protein
MLAKEIKKEAFALKPHVIAIRRDLHRYPEPSQKEFRTQQKIIEELHAIGITELKTYYKTGVAAIIRGSELGKTIGIRADMDALYITENT